MRILVTALTAAVLSLSGLAANASADAAAPGAAAGIWKNPKNNVHVRIAPCGTSVCGTVVWASERAKAKARRGGTASLVGTQLLREFRQTAPESWSGRVFVPDMGRTFSGTLRKSGPNSLVARGCLVAGLICKSQTWTRIG
jgi:uncharacterized protein (DUF2147 family)